MKRHFRGREFTFPLLWVGLFGLAFGAQAQAPPSGVLVGPTIVASLRNAADATRDQGLVVRSTADAWARHANAANYRSDQLHADFRTLQLQFVALRERFVWMGNLALEANRPQAGNALAELDAGLNLIEELVLFLREHITAGTLDRITLVRTCRTFEDVMRQWDQELRRSCSRMGIAL
jgi:hypothetical protein